MLFDEVEYVWPKLGYPPLVTPFSQYVKNVALMNLMQQVKGEERWTMIDNHTWDMILGKSGRLPGTLAPEIVELAKSKGFEFVDTDPQLNYPDALDTYRKEMDENGWEYGDDDEELFELAMHDRQYRDYKSGVAKKRFEDDLQRAKDAAMAKNGYSEEEIKKLKRAKADPIIAPSKGQVLWEVSVKVLLLLLSSDASTSMMRCSATSLRRGANTRRYGPDLPDVWWKSVPSKGMWSIKGM